MGIDAAFDEETPDAHLKRKVRLYDKLKVPQRERIAAFLRDLHEADLNAFSTALVTTLTRSIASVYVLPLHGSPRTLSNLAEAIVFIEGFDERKPGEQFTRYEIGVRYSNGDEIRGQFKDKALAVRFLRNTR